MIWGNVGYISKGGSIGKVGGIVINFLVCDVNCIGISIGDFKLVCFYRVIIIGLGCNFRDN